MRNTVFWLLFFSGWIVGPAAVPGAEWAWIQFEGAPPGGATDSAHAGWSAVEGFGSETVFAEKKEGSFQVVRAPDGSSPWLFLALTKGGVIPTARVDVASPFGPGNDVFVRLELREVRVVGKTMRFAGANRPPREVLSLSFQTIRYRYFHPSSEDGDGLFTEFDFVSGTGYLGLIPGDRRLTLTRLPHEPGKMRLSWLTEPGQTYEVEWSPDLVAPFETMRTITAESESHTIDFRMTDRAGFFRVRIP